MAVVLKNSPPASEAEDDQEASGLEEGEEAASPYEEHMLAKVMSAVYHTLSTPKYLRQTEGWMHTSKNLAADIGHMSFLLLSSIYAGAKKAGIKIPPTVFFSQGGAVYLTIDRFLLLAEKFHIPEPNPDDIREKALGVLVENVRKMFGAKAMQQGDEPEGQQTDQQLHPGPPMLAANPMSHAVGQGLQQQGLMGAQP